MKHRHNRKKGKNKDKGAAKNSPSFIQNDLKIVEQKMNQSSENLFLGFKLKNHNNLWNWNTLEDVRF